MIVVQNRFEIADGHEEQFVDRFANREGAIEQFDGFRNFKLLEPATEETTTYVSMTEWDSLDDFEAWTESEAFEAAHDGQPPKEMFLSHPTLEVHEVAVEERPD